jgi:hypothetical protein
MIPVLVLLILTILVYRFRVDGLSKQLVLFGWAVKVFYGMLFLWVHTKIYGTSGVDLDWIEYMQDSMTLNNIAHQDLGTYFRFLIGTNTFEESVRYLSQTNHWDMGDLSLLNDSRNVVRINSLLCFISKGNVHTHIIIYAFISFYGLIELFRAIRNFSWAQSKWIWLGLLVLPSLGFWTSSVLKEPLMFTGFALLFHSIVGNLSWKAKLWRITLGLMLMLTFKPYVLFCLTIGFVSYLLAKFVFIKRSFWIPITLLGSLSLFFLLNPKVKDDSVYRLTRMQFDFMNIGRGGLHVYVDSFSYYFRTDQLDKVELLDSSQLLVKADLTVKKLNTGMKYPFEDVNLKAGDGPFNVIYIGYKANSFIEVTPINKSLTQLILNVPEALVNSLIRPYPWDPGGFLKHVNFAEAIVLLVFFFFTRWKYGYKLSVDQRATSWLLLSFAVSLLVLIGWTTPVLGAIVRYRFPAYLAILMIAFIGNKKQVKHE